jgi:dolichol-phosphate mannosyltransferase
MKSQPPDPSKPALRLLSVVIPARDEEGCIASTVKHLHLELSLKKIPHEILVVDDGSTDRTWQILQDCTKTDEVLRPLKNPAPHGFGRAIVRGLDEMSGDAAVIMMADESDDCRDVARYWEKLSEGYDCVFGSRFLKGGGTIDYPPIKYVINRFANLYIRLLFRHGLNDTTNAFKAYPLSPLQPHRGTAFKGHHSRLLFCRHSHYLEKPPPRHRQAENQGNG